MGLGRAGVAVAAVICLPAGVAGAEDAAVDANGNAFAPGSLNFSPAEVAVTVGDKVTWTNTDFAVPHTATENHALWDLGGDYGAPPFTGFGPGESVERSFEAGTHNYFCEVHPEDMKAVVKVPVTLKRASGGRARATWSKAKPADGLAFDVRRKRGKGKWKAFRTSTTKTSATFELDGARWQVQARLRDAKDEAKATGWSPAASIRG